MSTPEKLEKRNIVEVEEAEQADSSKRQNRRDKMAVNSWGVVPIRGLAKSALKLMLV